VLVLKYKGKIYAVDQVRRCEDFNSLR
jgi:hypothetical protein